MGFENYKYIKSDRAPSTIPEGKYRCMIMSCEEKMSKNGNDMLEIVLRLSGTRANVKYWIVQAGEYWEDKLNRFFDAFPELEGSMIFATWRGAKGAAIFKENDNGFLEQSRWIYPSQAEKLPEFEWVPKDGEPDECPVHTGIAEVVFTEEKTEDEDFPF